MSTLRGDAAAAGCDPRSGGVFDAAGERGAGVRLLPYFDDFEQRLERLRLGLLPGRYRIKAEEAGAKKTEVAIEVTTVAPVQPFVIDLR